MTGQDSSRARGPSENAPPLGPDVDDERQPGLTSKELAWARDRAREGFSARSLARILDVDHSTIRRAAKRLEWDVAWGRPAPSPPAVDPAPPESPPAGPCGAVSGPQPSSGPRDRPPGPVAPRAAPVRPAPVRPEPGPPETEKAARLWHCRRCGLSGFDPNRGARAWHTAEVCDAKVAKLDVGLEGGRRERPPWELQW